MSECECLAKCLFFNDRMAPNPATAGLLKNQFCLGDNAECARFRIFTSLGGQAVPADLFPGQGDRADRLIAAAQS